ncbi:hypothetical protein OC846_005409 [Tilletia horrida]|uniref:Peptidase A1 domain-containing protein n=1 Tax=Tilletia horrida TaxID=155126 RepID=A0AAN6JQ90_9BASI|nr:hypothetical protein OC846_005409 [Tilletia horrida]
MFVQQPLFFWCLLLFTLVAAGPVKHRKKPVTVPLVHQGSSKSFSFSNGTFDFNALAHHLNELEVKYERSFRAYQANKGVPHPMAKDYQHLPRKRNVATVDLAYTAETSVFTGEVQLGDHMLIVEFDTASADCIVESSKYDPSDSDTSTDLDLQFYKLFHDHTFADGSVWLDAVEVGEVVIPDVAIGITHHPFLPASRHPAEGICGLAFQDISSFDQPGFFFDAVSQHRVQEGIFGISLNRHGKSELTLGAVNPELYHHMEWVHLIPQHEGYWEIDGELLGDHEDFSASFVLDSTAAVISVSISNARQIFTILGVHATFHNLVAFQFGQAKIKLNAEAVVMGHLGQGICILPIIGTSGVRDNVILGRPFFESVYLGFNTEWEMSDPRPIYIRVPSYFLSAESLAGAATPS